MRIKHAVAYAVASTAVAAASVMLTVAPANAEGTFAAIAYSPDDGVFGWSNFMDSEHGAQSRAVFDCVGHAVAQEAGSPAAVETQQEAEAAAFSGRLSSRTTKASHSLPSGS